MILGQMATGTFAAVLLPLAMAAAAPAVESAGQPPRHRHEPPSAEDRFQALAKALKLDAAQQAEVRKTLMARRDQLRRLLGQPADPNVPRTAAIRAINERTAERIRAVLNDDQKKLYSQPLPRDYSPAKGKTGVEEWMNATQPKGK